MRYASIVAMALALLLAAVPPAPGSEEKAVEARALELIETLVQGDGKAALAYLRDNFTAEQYASRTPEEWERIVEMLMGDLRGAEVVGVKAESSSSLEVHVRGPRGTLVFGFGFAKAPPHEIERMIVDMRGGDEPGGPDLPAPDLRPGMSLEQLNAELKRYFESLAEQDIFSGTALVARDGKALFTTAHGLASHRFGVPNRISTRFDLGSINKSFTQIAVGQLHRQGQLKLSDTVATLLPDYPNREVARKVTVKQLLEHTSGLGDIFTDEFFRSSKALYRGPSDFFPLFADEELLFEPGTSRQYSNAGYMVLGAIIEAVSSMPYGEYVSRKIFEPAGMRSSGFFAHDEPVPDVAIGYTRRTPTGEDGRLRNNLFMLPVKGNSAGSAYSTVEDLLRFDNAVRGHRLLPPAYTRWLFGGPLPDPEAVGEMAAPRIDVAGGLAGGAPGVSAVLEFDGDLVVIVLSNYDAPIAERIAQAVMPPLKKAFE
jgi:CubicO group peptidase (beta-lactamase class C family)